MAHFQRQDAPDIVQFTRSKSPLPNSRRAESKNSQTLSAASLMRPHYPKICVEQQRKLKLSARYFLAHLHIFLPKISKNSSLFSCDFQQKYAVTNEEYLVIINESRFFSKN